MKLHSINPNDKAIKCSSKKRKSFLFQMYVKFIEVMWVMETFETFLIVGYHFNYFVDFFWLMFS